VPIWRHDGSFFGTLCAIDPRPDRVTAPGTIDTFKRGLEAYGVTCSMSRRGDCYDNAVMESWCSTVKSERGERFETTRMPRRPCSTTSRCSKKQRRRHSTLGQISPAEFERRATADGHARCRCRGRRDRVRRALDSRADAIVQCAHTASSESTALTPTERNLTDGTRPRDRIKPTQASPVRDSPKGRVSRRLAPSLG
jgi:putative transposase